MTVRALPFRALFRRFFPSTSLLTVDIIPMRVLVCGGAGYIGSHTCVALAERGHRVVIADNFSNSAPPVLERLARLTGQAPDAHRVDVRDAAALAALFAGQRFDAVIHFAALKAVGESCERPLDYFDNNISGTITLLQAMRAADVPRLVFSSSATVYGEPKSVPIDEDAPLSSTNPYGRTKLVMEQLIGDVCAADPGFQAISLRYFNPVGAHPSGLIGEAPNGVPNNLMPYICQVAAGKRERLQIYGGDWPTVDGTGVRDYIHVMDLAQAHVHALEKLDGVRGHLPLNLGGPRDQRPGAAARVRDRQRQGDSVSHRRSPRGRCRRGLRRSIPRRAPAGLAHAIGRGCDVSRRLALAVDESGWLRRGLKGARQAKGYAC